MNRLRNIGIMAFRTRTRTANRRRPVELCRGVRWVTWVWRDLRHPSSYSEKSSWLEGPRWRIVVRIRCHTLLVRNGYLNSPRRRARKPHSVSAETKSVSPATLPKCIFLHPLFCPCACEIVAKPRRVRGRWHLPHFTCGAHNLALLR